MVGAAAASGDERPIRLAFLFGQLRQGGAELQMISLARGLVESGFTVDFVSRAGSGPLDRASSRRRGDRPRRWRGVVRCHGDAPADLPARVQECSLDPDRSAAAIRHRGCVDASGRLHRCPVSSGHPRTRRDVSAPRPAAQGDSGAGDTPAGRCRAPSDRRRGGQRRHRCRGRHPTRCSGGARPHHPRWRGIAAAVHRR